MIVFNHNNDCAYCVLSQYYCVPLQYCKAEQYYCVISIKQYHYVPRFLHNYELVNVLINTTLLCSLTILVCSLIIFIVGGLDGHFMVTVCTFTFFLFSTMT